MEGRWAMATMGIPTPGLQVEISAGGRHLQETITVQVPTETLSSSACKLATSAPSKTVAQVSQSFKYDDERFRREARISDNTGRSLDYVPHVLISDRRKGSASGSMSGGETLFFSSSFFYFIFFFIAFPARRGGACGRCTRSL